MKEFITTTSKLDNISNFKKDNLKFYKSKIKNNTNHVKLYLGYGHVLMINGRQDKIKDYYKRQNNQRLVIVNFDAYKKKIQLFVYNNNKSNPEIHEEDYNENNPLHKFITKQAEKNFSHRILLDPTIKNQNNNKLHEEFEKHLLKKRSYIKGIEIPKNIKEAINILDNTMLDRQRYLKMQHDISKRMIENYIRQNTLRTEIFKTRKQLLA
ncbi:MAG: hypothetical protein GY821_10875 [Gammaproteobacteria bacterium]|nr:hypothetical protein [Gammaproteobacteria bacterium]